MVSWRFAWRPALMGTLAVLVVAAGCGSSPRSGPSTTAPSSTSATVSPSSPASSSTGGSPAAASSTTGAQYAPYYKPNGSAHVISGVAVRVQASDFAFRPNTLSATAGTQVVLEITNTSTESHNFSLPAFGVNVNLPAGQTTTVSFTVSRTGTYYFYCNLPGHAQAGMVGKLVVS